MSVTGWQTLIPGPIQGPEDAVALVERCGFCTWGPIPGFAFPNLAEAMNHTATSVLAPTWYWKDDLHFARLLYYGKILAGQPTFLSPAFLPIFIAALGEEERNAETLYLNGRLSRTAKTIYDYLLDHPQVPSRELRRGAQIGEKHLKTATEQALVELQRRFLVCKVDITGRTRGTYSYIWDLAESFAPDAFERAQAIDQEEAREQIRARLRLFGIEPGRTIDQKLFLWSR